MGEVEHACKVGVYLKAMEKPRSKQWCDWIA
jgi:hypothetical protein